MYEAPTNDQTHVVSGHLWSFFIAFDVHIFTAFP